ncbi:vacuolar protein sorting-associated protein 1, partial [Mortierella sp. NVP41]
MSIYRSTEGCNVITGHSDLFSGQTAMPLARERENQNTIPQPVNSQGSSSGTAMTSPRLSSELKPTKKKNKGTGDLDVPPAIPDANENLLEYEQTDLKELRLMVSLYFENVKPIIIDAVPNAIMLNLVNTAKDELLRELLQ